MMFGKNAGSNETWKHILEGSIGAELGVWKGDSSAKFLKKAKHVHLVDSWSPVAYEDSDEHGDYVAYLQRYSQLVGSTNIEDFQKYYDDIFNSVKERFKNNSVTIHRMTTKEFFKSFNKKLDWVYVDASHSYVGCLHDLENSLKILNPGGYIFGDDYSDNKPGVVSAVNDFVRKNDLYFENFYLNQFKIGKK